jgi:hypothetical protein
MGLDIVEWIQHTPHIIHAIIIDIHHKSYQSFQLSINCIDSSRVFSEALEFQNVNVKTWRDDAC